MLSLLCVDGLHMAPLFPCNGGSLRCAKASGRAEGEGGGEGGGCCSGFRGHNAHSACSKAELHSEQVCSLLPFLEEEEEGEECEEEEGEEEDELDEDWDEATVFLSWAV